MPTVSIIVPVYNEEKTIGLLLEALYQQSYPRAEMEVILADGMSTDNTRQAIEQFRQTHPDLNIRVIDNHKRTIPSALNLAIEAAQGEYIVRLDAHSSPRPDYVERSVQGLEDGLGVNVGGVWRIQPGADTWIARSIAKAAAHPLGVGDALYRHTTKAQAVDTVPFGAFRKSLIDEIGAFDETLLANEDYEFNTRVRQQDGTVWLDPAIQSTYYARPTLIALAKQYARYGFWKVRMLRRYPGTIRWRQSLPPLFVMGLITLFVASLLYTPLVWKLLAAVVSYALVLLAVGAQVALRERTIAFLFGVPLAIACMHLCWGGAFLWSLLTIWRTA
ncbi:MAG: glycosyltransferase family 2 protein [Chloroflexi bacterium]|nr:MAG: glycosyltransferase family 2 protein [Chloroflexota bacterium]MBL1195307.1 glycosyltransferase family 2 protein [Chloroflexota bacterium]NOH12591.1 glycosyltransferase family 2 protein [Chloroflexota bacterium]